MAKTQDISKIGRKKLISYLWVLGHNGGFQIMMSRDKCLKTKKNNKKENRPRNNRPNNKKYKNQSKHDDQMITDNSSLIKLYI